MSINRRLGVDVDGVVIDFFGYLLPFANTRLGTDLRYEDAAFFNPGECFGVSEAEFKLLHDRFHAEVYQHDETPEIEGAFAALARLNQHYEIHFITAAQDHLVEVRTKYLTSRVPGSVVHFTNGHSSILDHKPNRVTKFEKACELGVIALIDDNPHELESWDATRVPYISFAQPWNAAVAETHPEVLRTDWDGILDLLLPVRV